MTASYPLPGALLSANDMFKNRYQHNLRWSALVALLLTLLLFIFSPRYIPRPYQLISRPLIIDDFEVLEEPPVIVKAPPVLPRPIEPVEDDEVDQEIDIVPRLIPFPRSGVIPVPRRTLAQDMNFTPSSTKPRLIQRVQPDYPEIARLSQLEGMVTVNVLVGPQGTVVQAEVALGVHPVLDRAAAGRGLAMSFRAGQTAPEVCQGLDGHPFSISSGLMRCRPFSLELLGVPPRRRIRRHILK